MESCSLFLPLSLSPATMFLVTTTNSQSNRPLAKNRPFFLGLFVNEWANSGACSLSAIMKESKQGRCNQDCSMTRFIYSELVQCNTWDTTANCKLQSGFSGEKCLEGGKAVLGGAENRECGYICCRSFSRLMRSGIGGTGKDINHIDTSGGGKMIRIIVNKAA